MKTKLYYFSGTGNSLVVARHLANELGDAEIVPIAKAINQQIDISADRIGIIFPVYCWGMPLILIDFIKKLGPVANAYIFGIATYGGMPGNTLGQMNLLLKKRGMKLSAGFGIRMPGNYTPLYGAISKEKQQKFFDEEKNKIIKIAEIVKTGKLHKIEKSSFLVNLIFSDLLYKMMYRNLSKSDINFYADGKCTGCGKCELVCPVNNIKIISGKPEWQHKCEQCMACLQWCPEEAIQFGKKTVSRKRYRHPETGFADFIMKRSV